MKTLQRYKKFIIANIIIELSSTVVSVTTGIGGLELLTIIIATPIGLILDGVSLGCELSSIIPFLINKHLHPKSEKHSQVIMMTMSKLNTISNVVSKAIDDGTIDQNEFRLMNTSII